MNDERFDATIQGAGYDGLAVVERVEISAGIGEVHAILGANGAGKSTTLRAVIGEVDTRVRDVRLGARDLSRAASWKLLRNGIAFVPDGARCFPNVTVVDNLLGVAAALKLKRPVTAERTDAVCSLFPVLAARRTQLAGTLSGGERQMLAVGRALMADPRVLLLDEPSAGLAPVIVEQLFTTFGLLKAEARCAIIVAEQNVPVAASIADFATVLEQGHVALAGPIEEVAHDARLGEAYLGL